ncbi:Uncharacterised protein [Clostridium paraputrificum]|uniref:Integrase catalytic domain-containing protein n=1 Tax=Clostridium paraputrificum TaxID=29363 RepID=A0A6N3EBT7_9CLOT
MVCTKTLYNYIDLGFMDVKNTDLPMKLRRNTKCTRIKKHKKKLGTSISQRSIDIDNRKEFGHWEIDTVIGEQFSQVFKSITSDNGSEFADLSTIESETEANTKIYFTHPYSFFEKVTNEHHNGLIRRFIPKGKRISDYSCDDIAFIEDWMNTLPRRILKYKTPEELFELHLDQIYSI